MISVIVIAKNEQDMIQICLESVKWADEVIVALNDSIDNTENIAKKYTSNIIKVSGQDFSNLRNQALKQAVGEWVLYVDADERVTNSLKEEIKEVVNGNFSAYAISRRNIIFGSEQKYRAFWPDWVVRLFKKSDFEGWVGRVHEYGKFKGQLGYSKNSLLHLTHRDVDQIVLKSLDWSNIDANLRLQANHPPMSGWRFLRIFVTEIFNQGIKRGGFFAGTIGVMDSLLQVFSMYVTYVRLWQLQQRKPLDEIYQEIDKKLIKDNFNF